MVKVLVLWADGASANLGVRALAEGASALLRQSFGADTHVDLASFDSVDYLGVRSILRDVGRRRGPLKRAFAEYDLILDMGMGDSFADIYGLKRFATICYSQRAATKAGATLVFGPQTVGPFDSALGRLLARRSLRYPTIVTVRDFESEVAARALGRKPDTVASDVVFSIEPAVPSVRRDVVINPSGLLWDTNRHVDSAKYRLAVRSLIEEMLERGRSVTLLPHVLQNSFADNDERVVDQLAREYHGSIDIFTPRSLADARESLAGAQIVVAARMHACLNALSCGTPAIPWAYSRKFRPLLAQLGWEHIVDLRKEQFPVAATLALVDLIDEQNPNVGEIAVEARRRLDRVADLIRSAAERRTTQRDQYV